MTTTTTEDSYPEHIDPVAPDTGATTTTTDSGVHKDPPNPDSGATTTTTTNSKVKSVELNKSKVSLSKGETVTLQYSVYPYNATVASVKWTSDSSYVASVSNGIVTAKNDGVANITITISAANKIFRTYENRHPEKIVKDRRIIHVRHTVNNK